MQIWITPFNTSKIFAGSLWNQVFWEKPKQLVNLTQTENCSNCSTQGFQTEGQRAFWTTGGNAQIVLVAALNPPHKHCKSASHSKIHAALSLSLIYSAFVQSRRACIFHMCGGGGSIQLFSYVCVQINSSERERVQRGWSQICTFSSTLYKYELLSGAERDSNIYIPHRLLEQLSYSLSSPNRTFNFHTHASFLAGTLLALHPTAFFTAS